MKGIQAIAAKNAWFSLETLTIINALPKLDIA